MPSDMPSQEDLSPNVNTFRNSINFLKTRILEAGTEEYKNGVDLQDSNRVNDVVQRIRELKPLIENILNKVETSSNSEIMKFFYSNNVNISKFTENELNLCKYFLHIDLIQFPLTIKPGLIQKELKI
jgi:hypothetical protein